MNSHQQQILIATINLMQTTVSALAVVQAYKRRQEEKRRRAKKLRLLRPQLGLTDKHFYRSSLSIDESSFNRLLNYIKPQLQKEAATLRYRISPEDSLATTLHYLATGNSFLSIANTTKLPKQFIKKIIPRCCQLISQQLLYDYMKFPTTFEEWEAIASGFNEHWQFPLCLGALNGKHIAYHPSKNKEEQLDYFNYKSFHSVILLAMCDANYKFTYLDIGQPGSRCEADTLFYSDIRLIINHADRYFPADKRIGNNRLLPYCIIADDAFPLEKHLMKAYPHTTENLNEKNFNQRMQRARQTIKRAFAIMVNRFKVLQNGIHLCPENVNHVVHACCTLHNFLITHANENSFYLQEAESLRLLDDDSETGLQENASPDALWVRNQLAAYFSQEGALQE